MLDGITPAPRGIPQIEVVFKIDANGILNVSAKDKANGKQQSITITASTQLDDKEVDALVKEAAAHAEDDKKAKERSEAKIEADSLVFQTEKFIEEMKEKLEASDKDDLEKEYKELKEMIAKEDYVVETVKEKSKALSTKLQEKGAKMYQKAAAEAEKEKGKDGSEDKAGEKGKDGDEKSDKKDGKDKEESKDAEDKPAEGEVIDKDKEKD
jgi:molecular chaperone DnaK